MRLIKIGNKFAITLSSKDFIKTTGVHTEVRRQKSMTVPAIIRKNGSCAFSVKRNIKITGTIIVFPDIFNRLIDAGFSLLIFVVLPSSFTVE
jgi:hypothetical protein